MSEEIIYVDADGTFQINSLNSMYLEEIERLSFILENKNITEETVSAINETIQDLLKTIRKQTIHVHEQPRFNDVKRNKK